MLTQKQINDDPRKYIKWMCHDIFITIDNQVIDPSFNFKNERLSKGSYGYTVNGSFHSKKWIRDNCVNVLGFIDD